MNLITARFFQNIVGEQTEKSASTGRSLAERARNPLWLAVADALFAGILDRSGNGAEAARMRLEGQQIVAGLPDPLRSAFEL